jgi:hypothetical protein
VATRWPTILARLRTSANTPSIEIASTSLADTGKERAPSELEELQSPKRCCSTQSVPTPTRQANISEFPA